MKVCKLEYNRCYDKGEYKMLRVSRSFLEEIMY